MSRREPLEDRLGMSWAVYYSAVRGVFGAVEEMWPLPNICTTKMFWTPCQKAQTALLVA